MKTPSSARGWCLRDPEGKLLVGCCSSQPWDLTPRHDFGDDDTWVRTQVPVRITEIGEGYVEGEACGVCVNRSEVNGYCALVADHPKPWGWCPEWRGEGES